jgi:hypothetical protein
VNGVGLVLQAVVGAFVAILADKVGRLRGRPPTTVAVFGRPGTPALITDELEVEGWYKALAEIDGLEWVTPCEHARSAELGEWRNEALAGTC